MSHNHSHDHAQSHSHDGYEHEHSDETPPALQSLIWKQIDFDNIRTLNESQINAGQAIIQKTWQNRLASEPELVSEADEQLIVFVPYRDQSSVKLLLGLANMSKLCGRSQTAFNSNTFIDRRIQSSNAENLSQQR